MKVGKCTNNVKYVVASFNEEYKLRDVIPLDGEDMETLLTDIHLSPDGNTIISGYAFVWKTLPSQSKIVIVYKEAPGMAEEGNVDISEESIKEV